MRALVVDDNSTIRRILTRYLTAEGLEVSEAQHGGEALLQLGALGHVDLVLVDWNMPLIDGLTFVKVVRAQARFAGVLIVMVTTESDPSSLAEAIAAGVDEYVLKPFTKDDVVSKLAPLSLGDPLAR